MSASQESDVQDQCHGPLHQAIQRDMAIVMSFLGTGSQVFEQTQTALPDRHRSTSQRAYSQHWCTEREAELGREFRHLWLTHALVS